MTRPAKPTASHEEHIGKNDLHDHISSDVHRELEKALEAVRTFEATKAKAVPDVAAALQGDLKGLADRVAAGKVEYEAEMEKLKATGEKAGSTLKTATETVKTHTHTLRYVRGMCTDDEVHTRKDSLSHSTEAKAYTSLHKESAKLKALIAHLEAKEREHLHALVKDGKEFRLAQAAEAAEQAQTLLDVPVLTETGEYDCAVVNSGNG